MNFDDEYGALRKAQDYGFKTPAEPDHLDSLVSPASGRSGIRGVKENFYGMTKAPPFGMPHEIPPHEQSLYSPKSDRSGLRGLKPSFYGADIELEVSAKRVYYKGDTMSAIALAIVSAALIHSMR
jgi:hypothetical protein